MRSRELIRWVQFFLEWSEGKHVLPVPDRKKGGENNLVYRWRLLQDSFHFVTTRKPHG